MKRAASARWAILVLLTGVLACAQEYSFRTFGNAEGLTNLAVRQIYQDHVGFLWVSTENGVFRYDGERFDAFGPEQGIPPTSAAAFGDAPDGSLLVGGSVGLYRLKGNRFEKVQAPFQAVNWAQGIQSDSQGHTYLGTDAGLMQLTHISGQTGYSIRAFPQVQGSSSAEAEAVLVDGGVIWYGCGRELCRMDGGGTRVFGAESGLPGSAVTSIRKARDGSLWVRARNKGLFVLERGDNRFRRPAVPQRVSSTGAPALDESGEILLPSPDGLWIHDGAKWRKIDQTLGLRGVVYSAFEDRQHSLWIGLAGRGLVQWRGYGEWENYSATSGLSSDIVYEIQPQADQALWVGTEDGLLRGERQTSGVKWRRVQGLQGVPIHGVMLGPNHDLWLGTEAHGAARLDLSSGRVTWFGEKQGLQGMSPYTMRFDRQRRLWAATDLGLFVASAPYQSFSRVAELPANRFWAIAEGSEGTIWAGGEGGLFAFAKGSWTTVTREDGLSNQEVLALGAGTDGAIWVGYRYGGGIDRVRLQAGKAFIERGVQRVGSDGLVYFLQMDREKRVWAGTEHGVDMWDGSRWTHYDMSDGLAWNDCNLNAFAEDPEGNLWIGTSGGLSRFQPKLRRANDVPVKVVFTKLMVGKKEVSGQSDAAGDINSNSFTARYAALNVSQDSKVLFRYELVGSNALWTETTQRELQFADLRPGSYRLEVEAQGADGAWSGDRAEFNFRILTPWYSSWWFLTLCCLMPVLMGACVIRLRVLNARRRERELEELKVAHDEIRNLAFFDPLTGLPNRRLLLDRLRQSMAGGVRKTHKRALLFVDLDDFKTLNDTLGHHIGDLLLQEVARRISARVRETDTVARLGGDEFVVLLQDLNETAEDAAAQAKHIAEKILAAVGEPYLLSGRECRSSSSIGITVFGNPGDNTNEVLQQADIAMYQAKAAGRNTIRFFAPALQAAVNARAEMEEDLRQALKSEEFYLEYQPQVKDGKVIGAEALIRWRHPKRGTLSPMEFIPLAEETGLILQMGDYVLEAACRQIRAWAGRAETAGFTVAVNISARQLLSADFVANVLSVLRRTGADPRRLELELTESMFVDDVEEVISRMAELKARGLKFSLDDFGTGYSSLAYLRRLPLDQLKIDQEFVKDILTDTTSSAIAQSIITLSGAMGLAVIAEGVETEGQRELLARLGCQAYQGFLFSEPLELHAFEALLSRSARGAASGG